MAAMKLMREYIDHKDLEFLTEGTETEKTYRIKGPFICTEVKNGNGRIYGKPLIERELVKYQTKIKENRSLGELDHPPCSLTPEFQVLTSTGWKEFIDLSIGEEVYSIDTNTNNVVLNPIDDIINEPYKGPGYIINGRNIYAEFTPSHRMLVYDRKNNYEYVKVEDIFNNRKHYNHHGIPKVANFIGNDLEEYVIPGINIPTNHRNTNDQSKDLVFNTIDFVRFLGFWLAEGSISFKQTRRHTVSVCQSSKANPEVVEMIDDLILNKFPKDLLINRKEKNNIVSWFISDRRFATWYSKLGKMYTKHIPLDIKCLDSKYLEELIYYFGLGDGRKKKTTIGNNIFKIKNIFATSKVLMDDLQECNLKCGNSGNLIEYDYSHLEGQYKFGGHFVKIENKHTLYQVSLATTKTLSLDDRMLKIDKIDHDGRIYCITVPNQNFLIRVKGRVHWTGNCPTINLDRVSHIIESLSMNGNDAVGIAKILDTPNGRIAKSLLKEGIKLGVSTRGVGSLTGNKVNDDFGLICVDIVADPSGPSAFVEGILENKEYIMEGDKLVEIAINNMKKNLDQNGSKYLKEAMMEFIKKISRR